MLRRLTPSISAINARKIAEQDWALASEIEDSPGRGRLFDERDDRLDNVADVGWMDDNAPAQLDRPSAGKHFVVNGKLKQTPRAINAWRPQDVQSGVFRIDLAKGFLSFEFRHLVRRDRFADIVFSEGISAPRRTVYSRAAHVNKQSHSCSASCCIEVARAFSVHSSHFLNGMRICV